MHLRVGLFQPLLYRFRLFQPFSALFKKKSLVGLLIELHCAGERIRREGTAALVSFTAELPRRLLPGRCQDSRSLVAGKGTPY